MACKSYAAESVLMPHGLLAIAGSHTAYTADDLISDGYQVTGQLHLPLNTHWGLSGVAGFGHDVTHYSDASCDTDRVLLGSQFFWHDPNQASLSLTHQQITADFKCILYSSTSFSPPVHNNLSSQTDLSAKYYGHNWTLTALVSQTPHNANYAYRAGLVYYPLYPSLSWTVALGQDTQQQTTYHLQTRWLLEDSVVLSVGFNHEHQIQQFSATLTYLFGTNHHASLLTIDRYYDH